MDRNQFCEPDARAWIMPVPPDLHEDAEFAAQLPDADQLIEAIMTEVDREVAEMVAANPELAGIGERELIAWIVEDVEAAIDEIASAGWLV
jgi:hypothetical protein